MSNDLTVGTGPNTGIVTSNIPLNADEYVAFRRRTERVAESRNIRQGQTDAMQRLINLLLELAAKRGLPSTGGRYHVVLVDGDYYVQWWSDDYIRTLERYGSLSF